MFETNKSLGNLNFEHSNLFRVSIFGFFQLQKPVWFWLRQVRILRIGRGVKVRRARVREICELPLKQLDVDMKAELIQALIPIGLWHVKEMLEEELSLLAGERYKRQGLPGYDRWGNQWGSVYLSDQKLPVLVPRVRDRRGGEEVRLRSYGQLQEPRHGDEGVLKRILHGLSCRRYGEFAEAFGLSSSTVSRRYRRASARELRRLCEQRLRKVKGHRYLRQLRIAIKSEIERQGVKQGTQAAEAA